MRGDSPSTTAPRTRDKGDHEKDHEEGQSEPKHANHTLYIAPHLLVPRESTDFGIFGRSTSRASRSPDSPAPWAGQASSKTPRNGLRFTDRGSVYMTGEPPRAEQNMRSRMASPHTAKSISSRATPSRPKDVTTSLRSYALPAGFGSLAVPEADASRGPTEAPHAAPRR